MNIIKSRKVEKVLKKYHRAGRKDVILAFEEATNLLSVHDSHSLYELRERYRDHALTGHRKGMRELHLAQDDLLLYWLIKDDETIVLENIVTHEELRKKK